MRGARNVASVAAAVAILLTVLLAAAPPAAAPGHTRVLQATLDGPIGVATVEYVKETLATAQQEGFAAVVLRLDTPGGGLAETEAIVDMLLRSTVPVLGFVAPVSARAASAGTIILEATDVAAMAPGTTIGSVQPVTIGATGFEPVTDSKILNFVIRALNETMVLHGRNASLAERFVLDNWNLNATEAERLGAIEIVASDVSDLLRQVDGLTTVYKGATMETAGAPVVTFAPSLRTQLIGLLSDPLIASLFLILGIYLIVFGLSSPGHGAEIAGVILAVLALIGLGFSVSPLAIFLILLGIAFFIVELKTPGFGVWGTAGIVAIVIGAIFLAPLRPPEFVVTPDYQLMFLVILLTPSVAFGAFLLFAMYKVMQVRRRKPIIGEMLGEPVDVLDPLGPGLEGFVRYHGELWQARSDEPMAPGSSGFIVSKEREVLHVASERPAPDAGPGRLRRWFRFPGRSG